MKVYIRKFLKIFILIHLISNTFAQWCNLRYGDERWLQEWRLIVVNENNQFRLLRDGSVPVGRTIYLLGNNHPPLVRATCNNRIFNPLLPLEVPCPEAASIRPVHREERVNYCRYTLYRIGFDVRINGANHFMETYRVCFDMVHMRPLFTINMAYPVGESFFLSSLDITYVYNVFYFLGGRRPPFLGFLPDEIFSGDLFHAYDVRNIIPRFNHLLGNNQRYMIPGVEDHIIDRGHLTPSADFTLVNLKRSTFTLINAIPQFKTIDNNNWRLIEEWVRARQRTPARVCTGVFDCNLDAQRAAELTCVVKLQDNRRRWVPIFLADNRRIPIPLWVYKIVRFRNNGIVFLTLNNIHHTGDVHVPENICRPIICPEDLQLTQTIRNGRTFCCSYREFIDNNVPLLRNEC